MHVVCTFIDRTWRDIRRERHKERHKEGHKEGYKEGQNMEGL
jgi:flagellar biosynthesis/type III secretory pathway protein FliH